MPEDVAQSVDVRFGGVRAELQDDIAVAIVRVERVVGKLLHGDEARRLQSLQPVTLIEQRRSERDSHGQVVRKNIRPEQIGIGGRVPRVQGRRLAAFHKKSDAIGQGSKQPLKSGAVLRQNVEAHDQRGGWLWRRYA